MPDSAQTIPLFGTGVGTKSDNVSAQMRQNIYVESYADPDKAQLALFGRPGLKPFGIDTLDGGVVRGFITNALTNAAQFPNPLVDTIVYVQAGVVNFMDSTGNIFLSLLGGLDTVSGSIRTAQIGTNGIFIDGVNGYFFDTTVANYGIVKLSTVGTAAAFPLNTTSVAACASRVVAVDPSAVGRFRWCAAGDPKTWNSLDFATAESSPDPLTCVFEMAGQLLLIGTQTTEFWSPTAAGAANQLPFQRVGAANIQWGTTSIDTVKKCNDRVIFLGRNQGGNRQVVALQGYQAQVISTPDVEYDIAQVANSDLDSAVAMFTVVAGHPFYILNLPTKSWVFDLLNGTWAQWITDSSRFAGQWSIPAFGNVMVSDYRSGQIYVLDPLTYTDNGNPISRQVISRHAYANLARLSLRELRIDCETGVGLDGGVVPGTNPQIMLQWSKDGAHTWGNEVWQSLGPIGQYKVRPVWRNLGRARDWTFKMQVTDPVKVVIIGAAAIFQP